MKNKKKNKRDTWIYKVFIMTFIISMVFGTISNTIVNNLNIIFAFLVLIIIILIGVIFDIIGMASVSTDEYPLHAKAAKKHKGAKEALWLIKNAEKVNSICNDIVGDVCGVLSGSISAVIAIELSNHFSIDIIIMSLLMSAVTASLIVGGKALGKGYAISNSTKIIDRVGIIVSKFIKIK